MANVKILPMAIGGIYRPLAKKKLKIRVGVPMRLQLENNTSEELKSEASRFQHIVEDMYLSLSDNGINQNNSLNANKEKILI